jgi:hypothetical protein
MLTESEIVQIEEAIRAGKNTLAALSEIGKDPRNDPALHKWLIKHCDARFKAAKSEAKSA